MGFQPPERVSMPPTDGLIPMSIMEALSEPNGYFKNILEVENKKGGEK